MSAETVPEPLVPPDVDLTGFPYMPLDAQRLLDSELWLTGSGEECKAAVTLWCKAWQQRPAASLPNNDKLLASYSGAGTRWPKVRAAALHGFVLCSDGRYYHPVIAEKAMEAWEKRLGFQARTKAANERRKQLAEERQRQRDGRRDVERDDARDDQRDDQRDVRRNVQRGGNVTSSKGIEGNRIESPLPPTSRPNGHHPPDDVEIAGGFWRLIERHWGGDKRKPSPKELSIARGWVQRGAKSDPVCDLMDEVMTRMLRDGKPQPGGLWFFDGMVTQMLGGPQ